MSVTSRLVGGRTWPPASLAWGRLLAAARWPGALLVVLGLVVAMVCWPWLRRDVYWNDIADAPNHLVRLFAVEAAFSRGELYPRWLSDLYLGYGYPLLNFYAPGTYYLGAGLHRLGMTFYASFQWLGVLAVALGAAGVYVLARSLAGGARHGAGGAPARAAALLAALVFVLSPYPFLTNLYVRAAVPEAMALALLPWLLWAGWRAWWRRGAPVALLAALVAALVLTHNISAMVGVGLLGLWLCLLAAAVAIGRRWSPGGAPDPQPEGDWGPATRRTAGAVLLGLGLSAFFWLPALAESRHVQLNLAQGGLYDPLSWLFDPCCATGRVARADYPHTPRGPADLQLVFDYNALGRWVPEKISLGQLALWLGAAGAALVGVVAARSMPSPRVTQRDEGPQGWPGARGAALALFWLGLAGACWFLNTTWSAPVWRDAPLLPMVQFPWRFYGPFALFLSLGVAAALNGLPWRGRGAWGVWVLSVGLVALLGYGALQARPFRAAPEPKHDVDERNLAGLEYNRYGAGTTSGGEFLPRTAAWGTDGERRGIRIYDETLPQAGWQAGLVRILSGEGAATAVYQAPGWVAARVEATSGVRLAVHQLLFPGWRAYVDGRPVPLTTTPYMEIIGGSLGIMALDVPPGTHHVEVYFGPTPPRAFGAAISYGAAALAILAAFRAARTASLRSKSPGAGGGPRVDRRSGTRDPGRGTPAVRRAIILATLATLAAAGGVAHGEWQARPRLGPPAPQGAPPAVTPGVERVALDVAGLVAQERAESRAPGIAGRGLLSPFLDLRYLEVGGEVRRWLYMHPPAEVAVRLRVPPRAYFQAGLALEPPSWTQATGDGVRFILEADDGARRQVLLDQQVNPRARGEDRTWVDVWVDLDHLAGRDLRLILRTDAAHDPTYDWAGWANPQVVRWTGAREHPGARHQW